MADPNKNNTTTLLDAGIGGDSMDESLVTQSVTIDNPDGTDTAKRARVVPGGDDGSIQTFTTGPERVVAEVADTRATQFLEAILFQLQVQTGLLKAIAMQLGSNIEDNQVLLELGQVQN